MDRNGRAKPGFLGRPPWLWSLLALGIGVLLASAAASMHARAHDRAERTRLERLAERSFDSVERQLQTCGLLVRSVQALFLSSELVTPAEFQAMHDNLRPREQFPSLQAIGYAERVVDPSGAVRYPTALVAPREGNERLVGLDIAGQPENLRAAAIARDTDQPVMSAPFELVQRQGMPGPTDGITIRLPAFTAGALPRTVAERRAREHGSIGVSFRVGPLIDDALSTESREQFRFLASDIADGQPLPLYGEESAAAAASDRAFVRDIHYGSRTWRLQAVALPVADAGPSPPVLTFGFGLLASVLMAALAWSLAGTRGHALALAEGMSARYRESEERFRALNELLPALVLLADAESGQVVYANQACRDRFSLDLEGGTAVLADLAEDHALRTHLLALGESGEDIVSEPVRLKTSGQNAFWATLSVSHIELDGRPHLLAVANDTTELRVLSDELTWQSSHDALTGLVNRREFERQLHATIEALDAGAPSGALLYMDLDQFKLVNDTSGHFAGDQLLAQLAALLPALVPTGGVLARLGGDEFAVLAPGVHESAALALAEALRQEIDGYMFGWEQRNYTISASIGVVMLSGPGLSLRTVLAQVDTACYMAKERGRNRVHLFSAVDSETARRRSEMEWAGKVREALTEGRFLLHFQELVPLWDGEHEGVHVEMLIRMRDEHGGMVPPGAFIPAAERFGLMPQLDRWVVATTLANFSRLHPSGKPVALCAINLSGPTFEDSTFADFVLQRLEECGVAAERVCFEITETAAVSNMSRAIEFMQRLRAAGCKFSLDDFGSGMASFGYLKNLPVDYLKIDGSFIRNIESDPVSYSIVRAVTDIGHQLGLKVTAEWVGDERARDILRGLSVDYAQGFAIHKPEAALCFRAPLA